MTQSGFQEDVDEDDFNDEVNYDLVGFCEWKQPADTWTNLLKDAYEHFAKQPRRGNLYNLLTLNLKAQISEWPAKELLSYWSLQLPWLIALTPNGMRIALLQDTALEIRNCRDDFAFATIFGRTTLEKDRLPQCRRMVWGPDCDLLAVASSDGIVSVFDQSANLLYTINEIAKSAENERYIVGLEFIKAPIESPNWDLSIIVIFSDGMVHFFNVSAASYREEHSINLSVNGISAAIFSEIHKVLILSTRPISVPKSQEDTCETVRLSCWTVSSEHPYYTLSCPTAAESTLSSGYGFLWNLVFPMKQLSTIAKMRISPEGNWLITFHCSGVFTVWELPNLRLYRKWDLEQAEGITKKETVLPVDVEWHSEEDVIVTWSNGKISVHVLETFTTLYTSETSLLHGRPRISSSSAFKGFVALECEFVFVTPSGRPYSEELRSNVSSETSVLDATSAYIETVINVVTNTLDDISNKKGKPPARRIYRLFGIKAVTPEERFQRNLECGRYDRALSLAKTFGLDEDKVYQTQWFMHPVNSQSVINFLGNIKDENWALQECTTRLPDSEYGAELLIKFGLFRTTFSKVFEDDDISDVSEVAVEAISESQKLKIKARLLLLRHASKLELYKKILLKTTFEMHTYNIFRSCHILEVAIFYARNGNPSAIQIVMKEHPIVASYLLDILNNFPETLDPEEYEFLLPPSLEFGSILIFEESEDDDEMEEKGEDDKIEEGKEKVEIKEERDEEKQAEKEEKDWVENEKFRCLIEEEIVPEQYEPCTLNDESLSNWYKQRAMDIEKYSGIMRNSLKLLYLGKQRHIKDLNDLIADFRTLEVIIYDQNSTIDFKDFLGLSLVEKAMKFVEKSTEETFVNDIKKYFLPFLERYNFEKGKTRSLMFQQLLTEISVNRLSLTLRLFNYIVGRHLDMIGTIEDLATMVERCMYAYKGFDLIHQSIIIVDNISTFVFTLSYTHESRNVMERMRTIKDELNAMRIMQNYGIHITLSELNCIRYQVTDVTRIFEKIMKNVMEKSEKALSDFTSVLFDLTTIYDNCFTTMPAKAPYKILVNALLKCNSLDMIEMATNFISCQRNEETDKALDFTTSVQLVISAARSYFNCCATYSDNEMFLAKMCLNLIKEEEEEITKELDLIQAVKILYEFGINMLPIQIRNCKDKMKLIEQILETKHEAYMNVTRLQQLANKFWIFENDSMKRYSTMLVLLTKTSFEKENYSLCADLCEEILTHNCIDGWTMCLQLGTCSDFKDTMVKLRIIEYAYLYCPSVICNTINDARKLMEKEVIYKGLKNFFDLCSANVETKDCDEFKSKLKHIAHFLKNIQEKSSFSLKYCGQNIIRAYESYDLLFLMDLLSYFRNVFHFEKYYDDEAKCLLDGVLIDCANIWVLENKCITLGFLLSISNVDICEKFFAELPHNHTSYEMAVNFYATAGCLREDIDITKSSPNDLVEHIVGSSDDTIYKERIQKYIKLIDEYTQASRTRELDCGIDSERFIVDMDYRRDTIYGLAMSQDLEKALGAFELAEKNYMNLNEVAVLHIESFLSGPKVQPLEKLKKSLKEHIILKLIEGDREFFKSRVLAFLNQLNGCDYARLTTLFNILNIIDPQSEIRCSLTANGHLKLLKKVKATCQAINYIDLIDKRKDFLDIFSPVLTNENFDNIVRLVKNLPAPVRGNFNVNTLYRKKAEQEFTTMAEGSIPSLKECLKIMNIICSKWLRRVDVRDLKKFIDNTVWNQNIAVHYLPYDYRKYILFFLVTWASHRGDFSENMRYLTLLIQERLVVMEKIWLNDDSDIQASLSLKIHLFEIEESYGDELKLIEVLKQVILDPKLDKEEVLIAYQLSNVITPLNSLLNYAFREELLDSEIIDIRKRQFSLELMESSSSESSSLHSDLIVCSYLWPETLLNACKDLPIVETVEILTNECTTLEQVESIYKMINKQISEDVPCSNKRLLRIKLLKKIVSIKDNFKFNLVAKLMDEVSLTMEEILEIVTNYRSNGDLLTLVWICIQSNTPELEEMGREILNEIPVSDIQNWIFNRIKVLPWDIIKTLTSSPHHKSICEVISFTEEGVSIIDDFINLLKQIQLLSEASSLELAIDAVPEGLISFHTTLL